MKQVLDRYGRKVRRIFTYLCFSALICGYNTVFAANYPSWWTNRNVIISTSSTNDWAAVNLGQLKWFATNAYDELQSNLPGGAGTNISTMVSGFSLSNNEMVINVGQLKNVSAPFWSRLIEVGLTNSYPWTTNTTADDNDYSAANLGQLKNVFSFDLPQDSDGDGLLSWVETGTGIYISPTNTGSNPNVADSDGDGIEDGVEVNNRTDPNNSETNKPAITIVFPVNEYKKVLLP